MLKSIIEDLNNDNNVKVMDSGGDYVITSTVNFPNNSSLVSQKVTVDSNLLIKKVEILNAEGIPLMTFNVSSINYKPIFAENYFEINSIINNSTTSNSETTSTIDDIIYPLYVPTGTVLTEEEKVSKTDGERIILTFSGEKSFTLVEETVNKEDEFTVIPTYGEPYMLIDTVASLSSNSINWISNGIEYYIVSEVMNQNELIEVARSINVVSVLK